jgi:hypothetical protein
MDVHDHAGLAPEATRRAIEAMVQEIAAWFSWG